jgi:hypothetical protein
MLPVGRRRRLARMCLVGLLVRIKGGEGGEGGISEVSMGEGGKEVEGEAEQNRDLFVRKAVKN